MTAMTAVILFMSMATVLGMVVGSFLNVCIARMPQGESVVKPRSRCPGCSAPIRWYQNIPVLSYSLLRGKCASCGMSISLRYPLVELLSGGLYALVLWTFGFSWATPIYWAFVSLLVVISFIDLDHQIIPNMLSLPGIILGFLASFLIPWLSWADSLLGAVLGGGVLWLVAVVYYSLTGSEGMGMGDVKLLAMIGAFLGYKSLLLVILASSLAGALVGLMLIALKSGSGKLAIPFGPYLAMGAVLDLFWGRQIIAWYLGLF